MSCVLYRAVTSREYEDIQQCGNKFRSTLNSLEDKQFAANEECGHYYGREIVLRCDKVDYILIEVVVDKDYFCKNVILLDRCYAVSIDRGDLNAFNNAVISVNRIN